MPASWSSIRRRSCSRSIDSGSARDELERERLSRLRHTPAVTLDGERVELLVNIEQPADAAAALDAGAVGVGLFRTEFMFMNRVGELPGEDEQFEAYRAVIEAMKGLPVTIRTVDVGADKPLDRITVAELRHEHALNPAMGLRAIRWSLSEPACSGSSCAPSCAQAPSARCACSCPCSPT